MPQKLRVSIHLLRFVAELTVPARKKCPTAYRGLCFQKLLNKETAGLVIEHLRETDLIDRLSSRKRARLHTFVEILGQLPENRWPSVTSLVATCKKPNKS
jgi:hypothetical protein